jgi:hypothetical protein
MAGLAPPIHALAKRTLWDQGVDARRKAGHDVDSASTIDGANAR